MKLYKDGMTLMRDTGSLTNALMENTSASIKVGDTFNILMWTDRTLWKVTEVVSPTKFKAMRVKTECKCYEDGTEYPVKGENGEWILDGETVVFEKARKYWYEVHTFRNGEKSKNKVSFSWGATTGYTDPSF